MIYSTIQINGKEILRPNDFSPQREDIYVAEITTCTGDTIADRIGWRYSDMSLEWDTLPQAQLEILLSMSGESTITFMGADGTSHTESIVRTSAISTASRATSSDGNPVWSDVKVEVRFLNAHN
ncbi:MAG: hypothetical protein LKE59_11990 [Eubacterium sp.]|jgi:hypothetical protein|nr:hypothetical protein [Eubacterium sp.]MCH4007849.1 hypothetical protein [Eubacterium sp.]MCH4078746.1 hypothetical protein [Eubacterium sp.]MCH4078874.1 hypothetical protein [Eubacterium sp.]